MSTPARTTIVYALAGGFLVVPAALLLSAYLHWTTAFKLVLWTDLAIYAVLLARWSRAPSPPRALPRRSTRRCPACFSP